MRSSSTINPHPPINSPWPCLETLPGLVALPRVWHARLGEMFERVKVLILQDNPTLAQLLPCPRGCGLAHDIVCRPDGSLVATCCGDPDRPQEIPLTVADITPLEVSLSRLGRALCQALGLDSRFRTLQPPNTIQFGAWSADAVPAILTIQACPSGFCRVVAELVAGLQRPFILFAPTSNHFDGPCLQFLSSVHAAFFPLDSTVLLAADGRLCPAKSPGELFAQFTSRPKEVSQDVARKVMGIVSTLDVGDVPASRPEQVPTEEASKPGAKAGSAYVFRWTGRDWRVVFGGGEPFYLNDMLAARCADYLLHHPNEPIAAFDLEVVIQAEKGAARARNSIQADSDARALREYRQELRRLQAGKQRALAAGEQEQVARLEADIQAIESELRGGGPADTGKRAYDNVRKAFGVLMEHLSRGGPEERAFAEHLSTHLSIGLECLYTQPEGRIWA